jgi:hypothetical protein
MHWMWGYEKGERSGHILIRNIAGNKITQKVLAKKLES